MTVPETGSKRKLVDAAESLFADKGFEAVSIRDITEAAKTNVAAVNYHFGSRDGLLALVMMRYMVPIHEERLVRLEAAERKSPGKAAPLEEVINALVRPLVSQVRKSELSERRFYKLLGRIFALQGDGLPTAVADLCRQLNERFMRSFTKALPTVAAEDLIWRIHFMNGGLIHLLTHQDMLQDAAGAPTMEATLSRFIRFAAAGLREGTETGELAKQGPQAMFDF